MTWNPDMSAAPRDGTTFMARKAEIVTMFTARRGQRLGQKRYLTRKTWWGKASHVPLYGWCHGRVEDVDLWEPTHWMPLPPPPPTEDHP